MPLQKVVAVQDNDSHWYVIPDSMKGEFHADLSHSEKYDEYSDFIDKFSKYLTGGDLNNTQLYADI